MRKAKPIPRRRFLRGMLDGAAFAVGLPLLDCFLDQHGIALANGAPLPVRFGTWFWQLGINPPMWIPDKIGAHYDLKPELAPLLPVKEHVNVFSRHKLALDGQGEFAHYTGWVALRCGQAPVSTTDLPGKSIDVTVRDAIGAGTRFASLEMAATGKKEDSVSFSGTAAINPPETSPVDLYRRVFGAEFQDPNSSAFTPNPTIMLRKSVLSGVSEERVNLQRSLGAADRQRLDAYFTSLRGMEQRLALQLQKPPPMAACHIPLGSPPLLPAGNEVELLNERHKLMTDILVMALACNQTQIFNMYHSGAETTKKGCASTHHICTHEETVNKKGYQEMHSWFVQQAMGAWAYFVAAMAAVREGDGTLLDNSLVFAHSEHSNARLHSYDGIPMMTAGRAGGRIKTGIHVDGRNEALVSELVLTMQRALGLETQSWGTGGMRTTKTISEIWV